MLDKEYDWPTHVEDAEQAHNVIVKALYIGFDAKQAIKGSTPQEKIMALALHYGDTLASHKFVLKQAYEKILCTPQHWPASHAWTMAGRWLEAIELSSHTLSDAWRRTVLLGIAHRIAASWFENIHDDDWLQKMDSTITQSWPFMENSFL